MTKSDLTVESPLYDHVRHARSVTSGPEEQPGWRVLSGAAHHLRKIKIRLGSLLSPCVVSVAPADVTVPQLPFLLESLVAQDWQLCSHQLLRAAPEVVGEARRSVRQLLDAQGLADLAEVAVLVTSELVTNALTAARALSSERLARLWLLGAEASVAIIVWDGDPRPPIRTMAGADDEAGRGLAIVEALSADWGYFLGAGSGGKFVWAVVENA